MACDRPGLEDYLANFTGLDPVNSVVCPLAQSDGGGLGLGIPVAMLLILGPLGLAFAHRVQHPGPILVAGILTAGAFAAIVHGQGAQIAALVFFFGIIALGFFMYRTVQTSL